MRGWFVMALTLEVKANVYNKALQQIHKSGASLAFALC